MRVPEQSALITEQVDDVLQYNQAMKTALAVAYAIGLTAVHRARSSGGSAEALDLASGPGLYTMCLGSYLNYDRVTGIDLSPAMVEAAQGNARKNGHDERVFFVRGDVSQKLRFADGRFDLTSFTDAAHHMQSLETVKSILDEMDRVTKKDGLVMLMDLARLRTAALTERYVDLVGADYVRMGLPFFLNQFRDSMYAAWTCDELATAIPKNSRRVWCHLFSKQLPALQIILGLPVGRQEAFIRKDYPWSPGESPVPKRYQLDWLFAHFTLFSSSPNYIHPRQGQSEGQRPVAKA